MSMHEAFEVPEAQQAWSLAVTNTTGAWIVSPAFARYSMCVAELSGLCG